KVLDETLRRRYGHDYLIISEAVPHRARSRLRELQQAGQPAAVVMASSAIVATDAAEFLAQIRSVQPTAKRVLVIPRGGPAAPSWNLPVTLLQDRQAATPVLRAIAYGMIDAFLPAPGAGRNEEFHHAISELLEEWAHDTAPVRPAARVVAPQRSVRG